MMRRLAATRAYIAARNVTLSRFAGAAALGAAVLLAVPASAQNEAALRSYFEGRQVTVRIDMPGTSDGVDLQVDAARHIDYDEYRDRLKRYGIAVHAGDRVLVTLVKVKKDLIEFQLGGGGYGTFSDDTSTTVYMPPIQPSAREKELERLVRDEPDERRRRELRRELETLRDRRERENRRIAAEREAAEEVKRARLAERRLQGGSRFNLRYAGIVPAGIRPEEVMAALSEYVSFDDRAVAPPPPIMPTATPPTSAATPRKGMSRAEAERGLGRVLSTSSRRDGSVTVTTVVFDSGDATITADFVEDVLVRYSVASK